MKRKLANNDKAIASVIWTITYYGIFGKTTSSISKIYLLLDIFISLKEKKKFKTT